MAFTHDEAVDRAIAETRRMAEVCRELDPSTPVPTCPEWDVGEMLRHVGTVQRWAATMVEQRAQRRFGREDVSWGEPDDPRQLAGWLAEGVEYLERMRAADPSAPMWAWGWPKTAGFWPRRMVHETGVHRADAEVAAGIEPAFDDGVAADGVDELLDNLPHAAYFRPKVAELTGDGETISFETRAASWWITLQPSGFEWQRAASAGTATSGATVTLSVPRPADLLLTLYGRRPLASGEVGGDRAVLDRWLDNSAL